MENVGKPFIGQHSVVEDVKCGVGVKIRNFCNIYGCEIGDYTKIASFVEIQRGVKIGKKCAVEAYVFIPTGVIVEDEVFIGPHVVFTNDPYPRATKPDGTMRTVYDIHIENPTLKNTIVRRRAMIGANATILPGVEIGVNSIVGAGSVVTHDVPPNKVVVGNPAKVVKDVKDPTNV